MENFQVSAKMSRGKRTFTGASKFFATVTITSVPNTQKMSYAKRPDYCK